MTLNFAHNTHLNGSLKLPNDTYLIFFFMLKQIRWLIAQKGFAEINTGEAESVTG